MTSKSLAQLVAAVCSHEGSWNNAQLAQDVGTFLWERYDSDDMFIYPSISNWNSLLEKAIADKLYDTLSKDEVLSLLFGLMRRNRIVEGLWRSMFERGVIQKLLGRLLALDSDKY